MSTSMAIVTCPIFLTILISNIGCTLSYLGYHVGDFPSGGTVHGQVYIADNTRLFIKGFRFTGDDESADIYANFQESGDPTVYSIRLHRHGSALGSRMPTQAASLLLHVPGGKSTEMLVTLFVYSETTLVEHGVVYLSEIILPEPKHYGSINGRAHQVAGQVTVTNHKQIFIHRFSYDGMLAKAVFMVGKGTPSKEGSHVVHINGRKIPGRLGAYDGIDMTLTLPGTLSIYDFDYLSVYYEPYDLNLGEIYFRDIEQYHVPYYFGETAKVVNCEPLAEFLSVAWKIDEAEQSIEIELRAALEEQEPDYIAFGVSGSESEATMARADVVVAYQTSDFEMTVVDYYLSSYNQCYKGNGACPDTAKDGGTNDVTYIASKWVDGVVSVTYKKPLNTSDAWDKPINIATETRIIWAIGPIDLEDRLIFKHRDKIDPSSEKVIHFGRKPFDRCPLSLRSRVNPNPEPWVIRNLYGTEGNAIFTVTLGPPGGYRGYEYKTERLSWGKAFYINGFPIPDIYLERKRKYSFLVKTGKDDDKPEHYHPFYLTSDPDGGYLQKTDDEKRKIKIYAGIADNETPTAAGDYCEYVPEYGIDQSRYSQSFGEYAETLDLQCQGREPAYLHFTPDENTPDELYYQSYSQKNLGWKIHVRDSISMDYNANATEEGLGGIIKLMMHDCEMLRPAIFHLAWSIDHEFDLLKLFFIVRLHEGNYAAVGISGSNSTSQMVGADVLIVSRMFNGEITVKDYYLNGRMQCERGIGACTDLDQGGTNDVSLVSSSQIDGIDVIEVWRPLKNADSEYDKPISIEGSTQIVWALGVILQNKPISSQNSGGFSLAKDSVLQDNFDGVLSYHTLKSEYDKQIDFGRVPKYNCPLVEDSMEADVANISSMGELKSSPLGCIELHENFQIAWEVSKTNDAGYIDLMFMSSMQVGRYLAFGLSGSYYKPEMAGADVVVVSYGENVTAEDYFLSSYQPCSNGHGACPDNSINGSNDAILIEASTIDGTTIVQVRRHFNTGDSKNDQIINPARDQHMVWAMGPYDLEEDAIQRHDVRIVSPLVINFEQQSGKCSQTIDTVLSSVIKTRLDYNSSDFMEASGRKLSEEKDANSSSWRLHACITAIFTSLASFLICSYCALK